MATQGSNNPSNVSPSWTWGSSARLEMGASKPNVQSTQLAQVSLPEPAVCTLYIQAAMDTNLPNAARVGTFTLNLTEGVGRVAVPRQISFNAQPSINGPLEFTREFVPVHSLQVDVSCTAQFDDPAALLNIQMYFVLSPLTRIPQQIQKLQFGMGLPGEADDLDDELRAELETEGPTVAQMMGQERGPEDASSPTEQTDDDEEPDEPPAVRRAPAWLLTLVDHMTRRLGREPTRAELARAVKRVRARMARR